MAVRPISLAGRFFEADGKVIGHGLVTPDGASWSIINGLALLRRPRRGMGGGSFRGIREGSIAWDVFALAIGIDLGLRNLAGRRRSRRGFHHGIGSGR